MRILLIAPSAYLLGGVQDWLYMLALGLRDRGHQVTVGVPDGKFHLRDPYNQHYAGLNAKSFVNTTGTAAGRQRALKKFLIDNPADLVVGVNFGYLYEAFAAIAAKLSPARLVMALHAIEADYFADIQMYAPVLDGIVTTNRLTEAMVNGLKVLPEQRVLYAPYGVVEGSLRNHERSKTLRIAWVGRIENSQKRVSDLQPILAELDKMQCMYRLSIAGAGPCLEELQHRLSPWREKGKVHFEGFVPKAKMPEFLAEHDVFLITSQWETGPIVAWEAMVAGLVVVSSEYVGSSLEKALIHNTTALLFPIGDARSAGRQIVRLSSERLHQELSRNGRELALSRYTRQASLQAWEEAFAQILRLDRQVPSRPSKPQAPQTSGRLERMLGQPLAELLRQVLPMRPFVPSAGSEWPHAMHHIQDQTAILEYAKIIETIRSEAAPHQA